MDRTRIARIVLFGTLGSLVVPAFGCATSPVLRSDANGAAVVVDAVNDPGQRPGSVRLAAADYTIDGVPVLSLRPSSSEGGDVPDRGKWAGALAPGEHVLEATFSYPPRAALGDDLAISVQQRFRFRSARGEAVRIQVAETIADGSLTASIDQRLGIRIERL